MSATGMILVGLARAADWTAPAPLPLMVERIGALAAILAPAGCDAGQRHHGHVVTACRRGPLVPARKGQIWTDTAAEGWHVPARQQATLAQLAALDGCIEITLQMSLPLTAPAATPAADGRGYLRQRQDEARLQAALDDRLEQTARRISSLCGPRIRAQATLPLPMDGRAGLLVALLVTRAEAPALVMDVDAMALAACPEALVRIDGPWPPYHFATLPERAGPEAIAA